MKILSSDMTELIEFGNILMNKTFFANIQSKLSKLITFHLYDLHNINISIFETILFRPDNQYEFKIHR